MLTYIIIIVAIALVFDFANGFNDAANSVATIVATRVLTPRMAVLWAAFFNFAAAFFFETHVAATISRGIVDQAIVDPHLVLAVLLSAITWTVLCTFRGLPISVSHSLIGSMIGAALVKAGMGALNWSKIGEISVYIVLAPVIGLTLGWTLMVATLWTCRKSSPRRVDNWFRRLQLLSAGAFSLSHGLNDAQKTMGIIMLLLLSNPALAKYATADGTNSGHPQWWIILSCHFAIAMGTYLGGWKVVHTLGHRVTKLQPVGGFCAETGGGVTIIGLSALGIPLSTTHTITGAIFGVGLTRRLSAVRWSVGGTIVTAWILTLPAAALMAAVFYWIISKLVY